jgi:spore germination cell wall hydrolase CwlJ-like protein
MPTYRPDKDGPDQTWKRTMTRHLAYTFVFLTASMSVTTPTIAVAPTLAMLGDLDQTANHSRETPVVIRLDPDVPHGDKTASDQFKCLAQAIYFEARGESIDGQIAVAQVVMNRLSDPHYPRTICGVVFQNETRRFRCQFSFACDGKSDRPRKGKAWMRAQYIASLAVNGLLKDVVGDSTHYHALYSHPVWAHELAPTTVVGRHKFYSDARAS